METEYLLQAVFSLLIVVALIGFTAVVVQRYAIEKNILRKGKPKRLKIEEFLYLDGKRKIALVKKDEQEFLILLSPSSETVIETEKAPKSKAGVK